MKKSPSNKPKKKPQRRAAPQLPETEESAPKQPFLKRLLFGGEKLDVTELEAGSTTILDILSPTTVDTKSRDHIVVDGIFHAYLYVTGYGYSTTVGHGWLTPLVEAGEGVSLNFIVKRQPKEKVLSKIAQTTMVNRSRMREVGDTRQDFEELDSAIHAGLYLKDAINRQGEDFYYMHTLIEVTAEDAETLEQRVTAVENLCVSIDMIARRCDFKHENGFLSMLPLLVLDPDLERKAKRNALTSGVAAAFPFASYELSDKNGVFLGLNLYNKSPVFLDFYDDYKYTNGNTWVGGSSGAGKTLTLQCVGDRLRQQSKQVIYIVPKKGHEFRPLCEEIGGQFIRLSPSSRDCINIMEIRRMSLDAHSALRSLELRDDSVLADKISRLIIFYSLLKKDLTDEDKNYLDASLVACYGQFGITFDNASLFAEDGLSVKEMPTLPDWFRILAGQPETKHLSVVLTRFVTGSASSMGGKTNVDVDNKYIVLDTSGMPDDLILPGIFWATDFANDLIMGAGASLSALIADELWALVGAKLLLTDELAAFANNTTLLKEPMQTFVFAGESYPSVWTELTQPEAPAGRLISYGEALRRSPLPVLLLSCDDAGAKQLRLLSLPNYRDRLARAALRGQYRPPPKDLPGCDALYDGQPLLVAVDMDIRRIDALCLYAKEKHLPQPVLVALEEQAEGLLHNLYRDTGKARVFALTAGALEEALGEPLTLHSPANTQFLTVKGEVVDAPLIQAHRKAVAYR